MTEGDACAKCGEVHDRCSAHRTEDKRACNRYPMKGQKVCYKHGGNTKQARLGALVRKAEGQVAGELDRRMKREQARTYGYPREVDADTALQDLIRWSAGHVQWLRGQVQRHLPDGIVWGESEVRESDLQGLTVVQRSAISLWVELYNGERDRLASFAVKAIAAGLAEREVRLAEEQGTLVAEVIRRILSDLELTPDQAARAIDVVPMRLREVEQSAS